MAQLCIDKRLHLTTISRQHPHQGSTTDSQDNAYRSRRPDTDRIDQWHDSRIPRRAENILDKVFGSDDCGALLRYCFCGRDVG